MRSHPVRLTLLSLLATTTAHSIADERQLEEIVVSAQRMEQVLQDVPISLAVVGEQEIAELNIFDFTETAALTPGADFTPGGQSAAIRIRGVGPGSFTLTAPQSVAVFMDEFSQIAIGVVFRTLVDVERLELLRGPQGTLYGLNAPSGAYNITTRAPNTEQVEGYIESSYSQFDNGGLDTKDFRGAIKYSIGGRHVGDSPRRCLRGLRRLCAGGKPRARVLTPPVVSSRPHSAPGYDGTSTRTWT